MEFYDGAVLASTDATAPYTAAWSFTSANNGAHAWTARAYDAAGNVATSAVVTLTVNITVPCVYGIAPTSAAFGIGAGSNNVTVTTSSGCAWTAGSNAGWLSITTGNSGTGTGLVRYAVAANPGIARAGTLTIAGQTFTVSQASGCAYLLSATSANSPAGGAVDIETLVESMLRLSQLVSDFPEIVEMDINPLKVQPVDGGAIAIDSRITIKA